MEQLRLREFTSPGACYRGKFLWWWNGDLNPQELQRQIRVMRQMGMGGFFMNSQMGLATPYLSKRFFDCVKACLDEARDLKMEAWLYDEDRWPSGAAGGLVTKNPKYRQRMLVLEEIADPARFRWTPETLGAFVAVVNGANASSVRPLVKGRKPARLGKHEAILWFQVRCAEPSSWYNGQTYLDTLNPEAVREFIRVTHEAYRRHCGDEFGRRIPGIFTDEPCGGKCAEAIWRNERPTLAPIKPPTLPWTEALPEVFRERYGYDLLPHLPELFYDLDGQGVRPARYHYHDCIAHLFVNAFSRQIGEWCGRNNLLFTGHVMAEDSLAYQVAYSSACMRFYEHMQAPGIDLLTEHWRVYDTAKQVTSVARQFGQKWRLTETYGCTGWDFPFAGYKALGDWQVALGINLRCVHLYWYTMKGENKRDYPASIGEQSPWWRHYPKVEDYFARLNAALTVGQEVRDLLVIHPLESMWLQVRKGWEDDPACERMNRQLQQLRQALLSAHLDFDYGDEDILSRHSRIVRSGRVPTLHVGKAAYKAVLVPPMVTIRRTTLNLLKRFEEAGGTVVFAGAPAKYVDAVRDSAPANFARRCLRAPAQGGNPLDRRQASPRERLVAALAPACRRVQITDPAGSEIPSVLYLLREDRAAYRLFICNTGHSAAQLSQPRLFDDWRVRDRRAAWPSVRVRGFAHCAGRPQEWDPATGRRFAADARRSKGGAWEIATDLPALGSRLFVLPKRETGDSLPARAHTIPVRSIPLGPEAWDIVLSEKNVLVLDRPRFRIRDGKWQSAQEILRLDRRVRETLGGIPLRSDAMAQVQPWTREPESKRRSIAVELAYHFDLAALPQGEVLLGIESPERFAIEINGCGLSPGSARGGWVDPSLRLLSIDAASLRIGRNRLLLRTDYTEADGLEIIYLLGDFGVKVRGNQARVVAPPRRLKIGDWCTQGLPFYSGSVCYRHRVSGVPLAAGERLVVRVPSYRGAAVRVLVNGKESGVIGWEPAELDITDLAGGQSFELGVEVIGHRRNSHGPLHHAEKWPVWTGPGQFISEGREWSDAYNLVPCGLMRNPAIEIRRIRKA